MKRKMHIAHRTPNVIYMCILPHVLKISWKGLWWQLNSKTEFNPFYNFHWNIKWFIELTQLTHFTKGQVFKFNTLEIEKIISFNETIGSILQNYFQSFLKIQNLYIYFLRKKHSFFFSKRHLQHLQKCSFLTFNKPTR